MKKIYYICFILLFCFSCSQDDSPNNDNEPVSEKPVLYDNVKIMDQTKTELDLNPELINAGTYQFSFNGEAPAIAVGDVIIGEQGEGFIRIVTGVTTASNKLILQTTQGSMSDVFKDGEFNFTMNMAGMEQRTMGTESFTHTFNTQTLYQEGPLSIVLNSGQVDIDPNWVFDFKFSPDGIEKFEMGAQNATLNGQFTATVTTAQATTLAKHTSSLLGTPYKKKFTKYVPAMLFGFPVTVPVTVEINIDLFVDYSAQASAAASRSVTFKSNNTFSLGLKYLNGQWDGINSFSPQNTFTLNNSSGKANLTVDLGLTPKISAKLYGIVGPYVSVSLREQVASSVQLPQANWDFRADVWLKSTVGIEAGIKILKKTMASDYSKSWETPKLSYHTPYKIIPVSGNNQMGSLSKPLANPIVVKVVDELDQPQSNVNVYFSIVKGDGTVNSQTVITDEQGLAEVVWTLGDKIENELRASAKKGDGSDIIDSPLTFFATAGGINLSGTWTITPVLGSGTCDEILICDESSNIINLTFNNDNSVTFLNDPADMGLNGSEFTQTYTLTEDVLYIAISSPDGILTVNTTNYNSNTKTFTGTYNNTWADDDQSCTNTVTIKKL